MKILIGAIALLMAAPVVAQTAPAAADPHAGHARHQQGQHQQGQQDHSQHGQAGEHAKHMACCKDGKADCCAKAKQEGKKMACCEGKHDAAGAEHSDHGKN